MADVGGVEKLGARLLGEVEECSLSELLTSLRTLVLPSSQSKIFNIPELDGLLPSAPAAVQQTVQQHQRSDDDTWDPDHQETSVQPYVLRKEEKRGGQVIELVSPPHAHHPSPAGKTALLHLIITHAILPSSLSSTQLSGQNAAVLIVDPVHHFSVPFLARTMLAHITSTLQDAGKDVTDPAIRKDIMECVKRSLAHVHIFRPASWEGLLATLRGMEANLFDSTRHSSIHRAIHSIILEDLDAFIPAIRNTPTITGGANPLTTTSARLTHELEKLASLLSRAVITTTHSSSSSVFRPPLPLSWPSNMQLTRLAVRRVEVLKFAPGISVEQAEQERAQRWRVVNRGRFEAWKVGQGRDGDGFIFRVGDGVRVERDGA